MAGVTFENVSKRFGNVSIIEGLNLDIADREFMVLVGPSGCGKSTALRMIAGLEEISDGRVKIGDRVVNDLQPKDRDVAMVFQSYALYPHMTVRENIEFGLKIRKTPKAEMDRKVGEASETLGIGHLLDRKPKQLSGGQRQRVAVARAIVRDPKVFLFDEPLSNLDAKLRVQTRAEITKLQQRLHTTCVYVTHDQIEAMTMGHRIAVMNAGKIQQVGTPLEVYDKPANVFVAQFIGTPPMNFFDAVVNSGQLEAAKFSIPLPSGRNVINGQKVRVGMRPENILPGHESGRGATARVRAVVDIVEPIGHQAIVHARIGEVLLVAAFNAHTMPRVDDEIDLVIELDALHLFDAGTEQRL
ncbi:MAG TPA: sn-glycerol-3-phosphate ABC transporter ATP-binding protein UgpC [Thermoanaerobaculia bacterium]|jgi:multiple sugar transport system ATP-binding protein|nr:sn-glycerol-3-phosphate ABC transporter ATP-binding protein UgpC [Thermoanaerobaculia bacterium]